EYYFTRRGPFPGGIAQIMLTKKNGDNWSEPEVVEFASNNYEFEPYVTPDGMILYFGSRRSPDGVSPPGQMHQWFLENEDSVWSEPKLLGSPFFERMVMYPSVSKNKSFYFTSIGGIYYSELTDGTYQEPVKLGSEINFLPLTAHSYIAADESYLIFDGQPRAEGKTDIYISYKKKDGGWTRGKSMGKEINSGESQAISSVSPDGECLFFTRDLDIYWMDASIIEEIKLIPEINIIPGDGELPITVQFSVDLSTVPDSIVSFEWDLDNNGIIDSRLQNPEFTYSKAGIYSIRIKVFTVSSAASKVFKDVLELHTKL
ncbi:MAG: PKD domain-containing protein, partial [Candidatus Heimdallarchaeota archaeon]|nr:PKD domain-containing protein [Candidatus Heimdallarchaeota archaeon]